MLVWSLQLDVLGRINQATEGDVDEKWMFKSEQGEIKQKEELIELESVLDKLNLNLA